MYKPINTDQFLSEEDLDLSNLSWEELLQVWNDWLAQAQETNDLDRDHYSHSAFMSTEEYQRYLITSIKR